MSGNNEQRRGAPQIEEQELATKTIQIQNKRFYLDVKQNSRGRFIKITEAAVGGQKSRILMSIPAAQALREKLEKLLEVLNKLPPHDPKSLATDGLIESEAIARDNRRYYLDLRENGRGRFLRMSMLSMGVRVQIALPADGLSDMCNGIAELINDYCRDEDLIATSELPEAKVLFAGNKTFYFDVGSNRYGVFLRISELRANYRTAVTIPEHHWSRFRDILDELASKPEGIKLAEEKDEKKGRMVVNRVAINSRQQRIQHLHHLLLSQVLFLWRSCSYPFSNFRFCPYLHLFHFCILRFFMLF
ncbi:PUR alpha protein [Echinococcus multilocularis]|uniref:PUR alpha protein n=1 Tax=Echinococcus multilocularis TaxID=6211 RepID=A0A068YD29_ECHMU|nr:PUR alpha protein [Echinococcus multilocularis]